ncbi:ribonuclease H-like domain-containing protein [Tanacetum coccineum]|uniref:Ribonuclease H-like domain-containing protein n=1 Tax=Tanacetum coccineum TaxID=301880 RepID=A0ABQ5G5C5_9ASTR
MRPIFQLDVNNAFLYSNLVETIYMKLPNGYLSANDNGVCRLKKYLYGLKQAPRHWNAKRTAALIENGFSQRKSNYSLYTKYDKGVFVALLVYVDAIIITGNSITEIEKFRTFLETKFMIKDLGKLKYFLEYDMLSCNPAKTPLHSKLVITNEATIDDPLLDNITDYQKLMGGCGEGGDRVSRYVIKQEEHLRCCQVKGSKVEEKLVHLIMVVKFEVLIEKKKMCSLGLMRFDWLMEFLMKKRLEWNPWYDGLKKMKMIRRVGMMAYLIRKHRIEVAKHED